MTPRSLLLVLALPFLAALAVAQELPELDKAPLVPAVEALDQGLELGGRFKLRFEFEVLEDLDRPYSVLVALRSGDVEILRRDHAPARGTVTWKKDEKVVYEIECLFPSDAALGDDEEIEIAVGFRDLLARKNLPPDGLFSDRRGFAVCGRMKRPPMPALNTPEAIEIRLERAKALVKEGKKAEAFDFLDQAFRIAEDEETKRRFRDGILAIGPFEARAINSVEEGVVAARIADEKTRYLREISGRLYDRGAYHGAIAILEEIGGTLEEAGGAAVIGAVDDATRARKGIQDARRAIVERMSDEQRATARHLREQAKTEAAMLDTARKEFKRGEHAIARYLARELRLVEDDKLRAEAYRLLEEIETTMLEAMPADERRSVDDAIKHPAWARLVTRASENFIFIGPDRLVTGIPEDALLRFDLAYVVLTDLFGRRPNPEGDRITVFFKELWDFGGATGGGKQINVGRADPEAKKLRVDTSLYYHELTHCIDDMAPVLDGWHEGLADFGAACALEIVGQVDQAVAARKRYREAFENDYVDRDLEYWRIQEYAPSAGFFCHFLERYCAGKRDLHDWGPYRRFFRAARTEMPKDGRIPGVIRALARLYVRLFDPRAFDDLVSFRLPLVASDREAILAEEGAFAQDDFERFEDIEASDRFPNSPLPRDLRFRRLLALIDRRGARDEIVRMAGEELGHVLEWQVIGPFKSPGADPDAVVFPPELEIDFGKRYRSEENECRWATPDREPSVRREDWGWLHFEYGYQDDAAIYALSHVSVPEAQDVVIHLRADDDVSVFLRDRLIGKFRNSGPNGSAGVPWRGPRALMPDAQRFPARLLAGRNKLLVKVKNRWGPSGMICAITRPNGEPIPGLGSDAAAPARVDRAIDKAPGTLKKAFRQVFDAKNYAGKFEVAVGRFDVRKKRLVGLDRDGKVAWRKYTVRPGFPRDAPSNLIWLRDKLTRDLDDFRLLVELETDGQRSPKIGIICDGDGSNDGLSGLTMILHPAGDGVMGRLERYDRLVYQSVRRPLAKLKDDESTRLLELRRELGRITVTLDGAMIFDACDMRPIENRNRLGLMTWNDDTRIVALELQRR
ncbi:MAG: hypothetical protein H6807_11595 [Planctomycetes bacterium]|nr:hypothetical protein [Planctomycetota bacterium]